MAAAILVSLLLAPIPASAAIDLGGGYTRETYGNGGENWTAGQQIAMINYDEYKLNGTPVIAGGEGISYHFTGGHNDSGYRAGQPVYTEANSDSGSTLKRHVGWIDDGSWLSYTVDIPNGTYLFGIRAWVAGTVANLGYVELYLGGADDDITAAAGEPNAYAYLGTLRFDHASHPNFDTYSLGNVNVSNGGNDRILKLVMYGNPNAAASTFINAGWFQFAAYTPASVALDKTAATLNPNQYTQLTAAVTPANVTQAVTWRTSDANVATVTNGFVRAVANGTAEITATSMVDPSATATFNITVDDTAPPYRRPFNGVKTIPGQILALEYDEGGDDVAYHKTNNNNRAGVYRNYEKVGSQPARLGTGLGGAGDYVINWIEADDWLEYTVDVTPGNYKFSFKGASHLDEPGKTAANLQLILYDSDHTNPVPIMGWQLEGWSINWADEQEFTCDQELAISASGTKILRVFPEGGNLNLHWYKFEKSYTAQELADSISSVAEPERDYGVLTLPEAQDAVVTISSSSAPGVVATDGTITPPAEATPVDVVLAVTKGGHTAYTQTITVTVPRRTEARALADAISALTVVTNQRNIAVPSLPKYFGARIASSDNTGVIDTDGKILAPAHETAVTLVLNVYALYNTAGNNADTAALTVTVPEGTPEKVPVTMAAFGPRVQLASTVGDTWDTAWSVDDTLYVAYNDGNGFGGAGYNNGITTVTGTPEEPGSLAGTNLNPGVYSSGSIGNRYSSGIYEVDGALYFIPVRSRQQAQAWEFYNGALLKSTDGGRSWLNTDGVYDAVPLTDDDAKTTFSIKDMSDFSFVKYGRGGEVPAWNPDRSAEYVYLVSPSGCYGPDFWLARISRSALKNWTTTFDISQIQYYIGGDGILDSSWSAPGATNAEIVADRASILHDDYGVSINYPRWCPADIVYNEPLERYFLSVQNSDAFANPEVESTLYVFEAPHPWGPWTLVQEENVQYREGTNLTWPYLVQKFTSADGKKMWMTTSGSHGDYKLSFKPVYLTTEPVSTVKLADIADDADTALNGLAVSHSPIGKTTDISTGYINGFDMVGDSLTFTIDAPRSGAYFIRLRYHTYHDTLPNAGPMNDTRYSELSFIANGDTAKKQTLYLGHTEQFYATWAKYTVFSWLNRGDNTITLQLDKWTYQHDIELDLVEFALYAPLSDSLPGCTAPALDTTALETAVRDYDSYAADPGLPAGWSNDACLDARALLVSAGVPAPAVTQDDIDDAAAALAALNRRLDDVSALYAALASFDALDAEDWMPETWADAQEAYDAAGLVFDDRSAAPAEIGGALEAFQAARGALTARFALSWELNGGAWPAGFTPPAYTADGGSLAEPGEPARSGYSFAGWYADAGLTTPVTFPVIVTQALTLHARWTSSGGQPSGPYTIPALVEIPDLIDDGVRVTVNMADKDAFSFGASQKAVQLNQDKALVIDGDNIHILIPSGTLMPGGDVNSLLVDPGKNGNAIRVTHPDGSSAILPVALLENGRVSYVATMDGDYEIIDNTKRFPDTAGHWALAYIDFSTRSELFLGDELGNFRPDEPMNRAMLATVLWRIAGAPDGGGRFDDVDAGDWFAAAVAWSSDSGVMIGTAGGLFDPYAPVTREQLCTAILRLVSRTGLSLTDITKNPGFSDFDEVSPWAVDSMVRAIETGLLTGMPDGTLDPGAEATRAQIAAVLYRLAANMVS
jgi:uncharacterized repeat protein (TIGR02543 family)